MDDFLDAVKKRLFPLNDPSHPNYEAWRTATVQERAYLWERQRFVVQPWLKSKKDNEYILVNELRVVIFRNKFGQWTYVVNGKNKEELAHGSASTSDLAKSRCFDCLKELNLIK
jgi:hypothetical protein